MKVKVFYFSRSYGIDHRWLYNISEVKHSLNEIYEDYSKTKIQIIQGYLRSKLVILKKEEQLYIYRIEYTGRIDCGNAKYYCLFGFYIDGEQYKLFLENLSFYSMIFYAMPNDYFPVTDEINNEKVDFEYDLKNILNDKKYYESNCQQFRMRLDIYLIEHPKWQEITFLEEKENVYNVESKSNIQNKTKTFESRFSKNKKRKPLPSQHYN